MKIPVIFEVETKSGFKSVSLKTAQNLLESGEYYCENLTIGLEYLEPDEVLRFTLMKGEPPGEP
jgi:hypothetical protein